MPTKFLFSFTDFLWILQQEEYETGRYLKWLTRFLFRRNFVRTGKLVYTNRVRVTLALSSLMFLIWMVLAFDAFATSVAFFVAFVAAFLLIPIFVLLAHLALLPLTALGHARIRARARQLVASRVNLKIVGIAGSFGKTTTKNFVHDLVRHSFRTQMIPGNINTLTGIAEWLTKNLKPDTELLVMEMDAYKPGEIRSTCEITPPTIAVLTNVAEQHLERFGSVKRLALTLGEIRACLPADGIFVADATTIAAIGASDTPVDTTRLVYQGQPLTVTDLSASNRENLARALKVAEALSISRDYVEDAVTSLTIPERRQKPGTVLGYDGIDDSYNITLITARAGLAAARTYADTKGKKLLVVAAGITELGPEEKDGNVRLGEALAEKADHIVLLKSVFADDIQKGIEGKPTTTYAQYEDFVAAAHAAFPPSEWVLLLQPTLNDLFY